MTASPPGADGARPAGPAGPAPTFADIATAAHRIEGVAHRTPIFSSQTANRLAGAELLFKCENLQRAGAFKFRGAYNSIAALSPAARRRGVVAFSSGNHAQAVALASSLLGVAATIVMPTDAPAMKMAATRGYGAEIVTYDRYTQDRLAMASAIAAERGGVLIPPYDHADIIAGQGTAALELIEESGPLDFLIVPLGGGGLLAGSALAAAQLAPGCAVIGVEPEAGNDGQQSLRAGTIVQIPVPRSIADGALVTHLGSLNFPIIRSLVRDIVTVPDQALGEAVRFFVERMKIVVEPTGCLAAAAAFARAVPFQGKRVGIILSGGNVDPKRLAAFLDG